MRAYQEIFVYGSFHLEDYLVNREWGLRTARRSEGGEVMTPAQSLALKYHCRFAFETLNPRLSWLERDFSVVLSVNSGYE